MSQGSHLSILSPTFLYTCPLDHSFVSESMDFECGNTGRHRLLSLRSIANLRYWTRRRRQPISAENIALPSSNEYADLWSETSPRSCGLGCACSRFHSTVA